MSHINPNAGVKAAEIFYPLEFMDCKGIMELTHIEIKQDMPGFNGFLGAWLCRGPVTLLVDVGPANTAGRLVETLDSMGIDRVDFILITHIHIDHAGAVSDLAEHYPMARVIAHEKGIKFLRDPTKLWAGSLKVLGATAEAYGPPKPVKEEKLIPHTQGNIPGLTIIETPGHAAHHLSFTYQDHLFSGEAGGNYFRVGDNEYLRPATPPRFFLEVFLRSVDRLLGLKNQTICYAHFGMAPDSHRLLKRFREQLIRWKKIISEQIRANNGRLVDRCMAALLEQDPELVAFEQMDPDVQNREKIFLTNSINGFIEFLREGADGG